VKEGQTRGDASSAQACIDDEDLIPYSFWLFDTEENARAAEATFNTLRGMPEAPATFISVDVCEVIGQA
jgi:hypothetical protein